MDPPSVPDPLARIEFRLRRVSVVLGLLIVAILLLVGLAWTRLSPPDQLRLRTLTIVDERGVERVRIGGQLPDAVVNGRRVPRGEQAAGVLIYDDAGQVPDWKRKILSPAMPSPLDLLREAIHQARE